MKVVFETAGAGLRDARRRHLMKRALEIIGWLVALALFAFAGRAVLAAAPAWQGGEADRLSAREQREARELAARFVERLRMADDPAPLLDEMFVEGFGERACGGSRTRCR